VQSALARACARWRAVQAADDPVAYVHGIVHAASANTLDDKWADEVAAAVARRDHLNQLQDLVSNDTSGMPAA
jgi:hypothetical protein